MRPTHPDYEGLQVRAAENYPEVVHYSDKEALPPRNGPSQGKRTCRLARPVFIALLVVAVLVVVGAAVGGGVGAVLAAKNSKPSSVQTVTPPATATLSVSTITASSSSSPPPLGSSSSSPTLTSITSTTTSSSPTATSGMGIYNCPSDNGTSYSPKITNRYTFQILCDTDFYGKGINNGNVVDVQNVLATSIEACIDQCAAQRYAGGNCSAVSYGANITQALSRGGVQGNCFLKDQRSAVNQADASGQQEAAFLIST